MPNLHDLLDAATDDLPPLPSLAPQARRIARRRTRARRSAGVALCSSILILGVGATVIGLHASTPSGTGTSAGTGSSGTRRIVTPTDHFHDEAVSVLQQIWPIAGERIEFVGKPNQTIYAAVTPTASYRVVLAFYQLPANDPQNQPHVPCATDTGSQSAFACSELPDGHTVAARVGEGTAEFDFTSDDVYVSLNVLGGPMARLDAHKLLTMAESAIFQQLSADAHRFNGVITAMPEFFPSTSAATPSASTSTTRAASTSVG